MSSTKSAASVVSDDPPTAAAPRLRRAPAIAAAVAAAVVIVDQLTKWWALNALDDGRVVDLVWTLRFRLIFNTGSAFGLGEGLGPVIGIIALGVAGLLLWIARDAPDLGTALCAGLVAGGAVGNLLDRAFRDGEGFLGGAVVDFVDLQWWPVFNVADMAITLGAIGFVFFSSRRPA